ncbi:hypothetical protein [Metallibacterium sp.]
MDDLAKAEILAEIAAKNGGLLLPRKVWEEAKAKDHPLHDYFEWNDRLAGKRYRDEQARVLIRGVRISTESTRGVFRAPQWVRSPHVPRDEQGYQQISDIATVKARKEVLRQELDRCVGVLTRLSEIARVMGMHAELQRALQAIEMLRGRLMRDAA